jgi:peroxiredoxin Q/BCP
MRKLLVLTALAAVLCTMAYAGEAPAEEGLQAGQPAPAFSLAGSDGETHSLADHAGKRAVVIAWFPKAFTGG